MTHKRKKSAGWSATAVVLLSGGIVLALFLLAMLIIRPLPPEELPSAQEPSVSLPPELSQEPVSEKDAGVPLRVLLGDTVIDTNMSDYLYSVVAAEMPASFELEALKAQTVAARTYTYVKMAVTTPHHPDADVCDDITCCQAYILPEQAAENWGDGAAYYESKLRDAVAATDGLVALYDNQPIDAVFHSSSPGATVDAVNVWGSDIPYLKSVSSPEGSEVPNYEHDVIFTPEEMRAAALAVYPDMNLTGSPETWFTNWHLMTSGTVDQMTLGGVPLRGTQVRSLFGLRSATFTIEADSEQIIFHVRGYGHGVGMSQYGANALARQGKTFDEIICWYYTGVDVAPWSPSA